MTETKEAYSVQLIAPSWQSRLQLIERVGPEPAASPPPDTVLATLEAIREIVHDELACIERDGGCAGAWLRVEALVGKVLR